MTRCSVYPTKLTTGVRAVVLLASFVFAPNVFAQNELHCSAIEETFRRGSGVERTGRVFYSAMVPLPTLLPSALEEAVASEFEAYVRDGYGFADGVVLREGQSGLFVVCDESRRESYVVGVDRASDFERRRGRLLGRGRMYRVPYDRRVETGWVPTLEMPDLYVEGYVPAYCEAFAGFPDNYITNIFQVDSDYYDSQEDAQEAFRGYLRGRGVRVEADEVFCFFGDLGGIQSDRDGSIADSRNIGWRAVNVEWQWVP